MYVLCTCSTACYVNVSLCHLVNKAELSVTDSGEAVCVDPGERVAILGTGGPGPPENRKGQQLVPDSGGEGT